MRSHFWRWAPMCFAMGWQLHGDATKTDRKNCMTISGGSLFGRHIGTPRHLQRPSSAPLNMPSALPSAPALRRGQTSGRDARENRRTIDPGSDLVGIHGCEVRPLAGRSSQRAQMGQRSDPVRTGLGVRPRAAMPARTVERSTRGLTSSGDTVARSDPWPGDHRNARRWARGLTPCAPASGSDLGPRCPREPSNDRPGV